MIEFHENICEITVLMIDFYAMFQVYLYKEERELKAATVRLSERMLIPEEKNMELDSVFEEIVARGLINDEQPSLVGHLSS